MKLIPLTHGQAAIVDDEDFYKFMGMEWRAFWNGRSFYADTKIKGRSNFLHRLLMGNPSSLVDHINRNTLDDRKENLRICTQTQNQQNRKGPARHSKSGIRGVTFHLGRWRATIVVLGISKHLGRFDTKEDAAIAYESASKKYFGEFRGASCL